MRNNNLFKVGDIVTGQITRWIKNDSFVGWRVKIGEWTAQLPYEQMKAYSGNFHGIFGRSFQFMITSYERIKSYHKIEVSFFQAQVRDLQVGDSIKVTTIKVCDKSRVMAKYNDIKIFIPAEEIPNYKQQNYKPGFAFYVNISEICKNEGIINGSVKEYLNHQLSLLDKLPVGKLYNAKVLVNRCNSFLIIDINGVIGIVDKEDYSLNRRAYQSSSNFCKENDIIECVILQKKAKLLYRESYIITFSAGIKQAEIIREKAHKLAMREYAKDLKQKRVVEATVAQITKEGVRISIDKDVFGFIPRSELTWGTGNARTQTFIGERIKVLFLYEEDGVLFFSLKQLNDDIYEQNLYEMDTMELLEKMNIYENSFVGKVKRYCETLWFTDIYASSDKNEGQLLVDPITANPINIIILQKANDLFVEDLYYRFSIQVADCSFRKSKRTPYLFKIPYEDLVEISKSLVRNPYKALVDRSFYHYSSPQSNASIANLLEEVGQNMYDSKDRMFFELLQNADDAAASCGVKVTLQSVDGFLIMCHDGMPFNKKDYSSITSAARSTKGSVKAKTGYKGIGFKSVFTNSTQVHIRTGGFSFVFDKGAPIFSDFKEFYFTVNKIHDIEKQNEYLKDQMDEYESFQGVDNIPWQLLPFWEETIPESLSKTIYSMRTNVAIALAMTDANKREYIEAILGVLDDPKFMLFLRNTNRISYQDDSEIFTISNKKEDGITVLQNTRKGREVIKRYLVKEGSVVDVTDDAFSAVGVDIKIAKEKKKANGKEEFVFVDQFGQKIPSVPPRISSSTNTQISYAIKVNEENKIVPLNARHTLYAYLPMVETRFPFPIYINADFILKSNRQGIQSDNRWNHFLMYHIGRNYVKWISAAASTEQKEYLSLLLKQYFDETDKDMKDLARYFNKGYLDGIENEAFILNDLGEVVEQYKIMLDRTGLSEIIGTNNFCWIVNSDEKRLPHPSINSTILSESIFSKITHINDVREQLKKGKNLKNIRHWISQTDEGKLNSIFDWLKTLADGQLVKQLPLFKFEGKYRSIKEVASSANFLFIDSRLEPIRDILSKLGFRCSDIYIQSHPLYKSFLESNLLKGNLINCLERIIKKSEQDRDKLTASEKNQLYLVVLNTSLACSKESLCSYWTLFRNLDGTACALSEMMKAGEDINENLLFSSFIINEDEYIAMSEQLRSKLMPRDNIYQSAIIRKWKGLIDKWTTIGQRLKWTETEYSKIYDIVKNHYNAYKNNNPYLKVDTISLLAEAKYILSGTNFYSRSETFYVSDLSDDTLREAANKLLSVSIPSKSALPFLSKEPFVTSKKYWTSQKCNANVILTDQEVDAILKCCKDNKEDFFKTHIIKETESGITVCERGNYTQYFVEDDTIAEYVNAHLKDTVRLSNKFKSHISNEYLLKGDDLFDALFASVNCQDEGVSLLNIVKTQSVSIKQKYIKAIGQINLKGDSFENNAFMIALFTLCSELTQHSNASSSTTKQVYPSRSNVFIEYCDNDNYNNFKSLSDIPLQGKVIIDKYSFDMDEINTATLLSFQKSARVILQSMRKSNIKEDYLKRLFDLEASMDATAVFNSINKNDALKNSTQLAFALRYMQNVGQLNLRFYINARDDMMYPVGHYKEWYTKEYSFVNPSFILSDEYSDIVEILQASEIATVYGKYKFFETADGMDYIKSNLTEDETAALLDYVYAKWKDDNSFWSKDIVENKLVQALDIDKDKIVVSEKFSLSDEGLPTNIKAWIGRNIEESSQKIDFIKELFNLNGEDSHIVEVRRFLSGEIPFKYEYKDCENESIQDKLCEWIYEKSIQLTDIQYEQIKSMLDDEHFRDVVDMETVNEKILNQDPEIELSRYDIYKYDGIIPRYAYLTDYDRVFYNYEDGDYCTDNKKIIVSASSWRSLDRVLMGIASNRESGFSSDDYMEYMQIKGNKEKEYESDFENLKTKMASLENENERIRNLLARQNVEVGFIDDRLGGLSDAQKMAALKEAKAAVVCELRNQGYFVPESSLDDDEWTRIKGVMKGCDEYTVIVRSYKDSQSRNFTLNAYDWENLMNGNSMLWVNTSRGPECFPFRDLVKNKTRITLSFNTINVDYPKRMAALAESMRYFKGISFDFGPDISHGHTCAQRFLTPEQELTEVLKEDNIQDIF